MIDVIYFVPDSLSLSEDITLYFFKIGTILTGIEIRSLITT